MHDYWQHYEIWTIAVACLYNAIFWFVMLRAVDVMKDGGSAKDGFKSVMVGPSLITSSFVKIYVYYCCSVGNLTLIHMKSCLNPEKRTLTSLKMRMKMSRKKLERFKVICPVFIRIPNTESWPYKVWGKNSGPMKLNLQTAAGKKVQRNKRKVIMWQRIHLT